MTANEFMQDTISRPNAVNQYNEHTIRFHARCCHRRGRSEYIMLRQVARNHGYIKECLEVARNEWSLIDTQQEGMTNAIQD